MVYSLAMADTVDQEDHPRATLGEHLEELRRRILYALLGLVGGMVVGLVFGRTILDVLKRSYVQVMQANGLEADLAVLSVITAFSTYFRVALLAGALLASPWVFYQLWAFVAAGLYRRERRAVMLAVPFSAALFVSGAMFFLLAVSGPMLTFFIGFARWVGAKPVITLESHIAFMTDLMLVFGLGFQMPLAVVILARAGLVSVETFRRYRKHVIVGILVLSALVTSPDVVDQLALGLPMWLLYEVGVILAQVLSKRAAPRDEDQADS